MNIFKTTAAFIAGSLAIASVASAQMLGSYSEEMRSSKLVMDRIEKLPDTIECVSVVKLMRHNPGDVRTKQATARKYVFRLSNINMNMTGGYQLMESEPSVAVYSMHSGGAVNNLFVRVDMNAAKLLVASPALPQPNTCQLGMEVVRF